MEAGVEIYLAECHNRDEGICVGALPGEQDFKAATVLVNMSADPADRVALWPLLHKLSIARCTTAVFGGTDWRQRLQERLKPVKAEFVSAVVFVGSKPVVLAETVQTAIDTLRQSFGSKLKMLVVVSAIPDRLATSAGVSGFVRSAQKTNGETARQVFLTLAMVMAPKTLCAIDAADLMQAFGPANSQAVMSEALWLRADDSQLVFLSCADELAVRSARYVVATPFMPGMRLDEVRGVLQAVRDSATATDKVVIHAACDAFRPGVHSERAGLLLILCGGASDERT